MKLNRKHLRKMILLEMDKAAYGRGMDQQDAIASKASFPAADEIIDGLLRVVGNDGSFETQEARSAILALQDVSNADQLMDALHDVESYISAALRQRHINESYGDMNDPYNPQANPDLVQREMGDDPIRAMGFPDYQEARKQDSDEDPEDIRRVYRARRAELALARAINELVLLRGPEHVRRALLSHMGNLK